MPQCQACLSSKSAAVRPIRRRVFVCAQCRSEYSTSERRPSVCPHCGFDPLTQLQPLYRMAALAAVIIFSVLLGLALLS
jgi:hypothetical protein